MSHLPVVGALAAAGLLAAALVLRTGAIRRLALAAMLVVALAAIPAFLSGESAEEVIENRPGIEENRIERHEDLAKVALVGVELAGAIALAGLLVFRRRTLPGTLLVVVLIVDAGAFALLASAATLGGEISHPEIRADAAPAPPAPGDDD